MKPSVALFRSAIVTFLLATGLSACSSSSSRDEQSMQQPSQEPITLLDSSQQASAQSDSSANKHRTIEVKKSHPRKYTVKTGDTLWDISSLYLKDPWYWPEIWHKNQQIANPHLIYPGDILTLVYVDGQPQIMHKRPTHKVGNAETTQELPIVKLGPTLRRESLDASIPTIPGDAIRQFLTKPRVVTREELENAPYVLASDDEHLILGQGDRIYIRGEIDKERVRYTVFRPGEELIDPETGDALGYEAIYAGEAHISDYGDPATGSLTITDREVLIGDRLLPLDKSKINNLYFPRIPDKNVKGTIISLFDSFAGVAKFQIAVINRGDRDGIEVGHLLATQTKGRVVDDPYTQGRSRTVTLPSERTGLMMIFSTFDEVSYGLILESTRPIQKLDIVQTPK